MESVRPWELHTVLETFNVGLKIILENLQIAQHYFRYLGCCVYQNVMLTDFTHLKKRNVVCYFIEVLVINVS